MVAFASQGLSTAMPSIGAYHGGSTMAPSGTERRLVGGKTGSTPVRVTESRTQRSR
jgi:hypothetical protein